MRLIEFHRKDEKLHVDSLDIEGRQSTTVGLGHDGIILKEAPSTKHEDKCITTEQCLLVGGTLFIAVNPTSLTCCLCDDVGSDNWEQCWQPNCQATKIDAEAKSLTCWSGSCVRDRQVNRRTF